MHPWRSGPPVIVFWRASALPPSSLRVGPTRPAQLRCGRLREAKESFIHTEPESFLSHLLLSPFVCLSTGTDVSDLKSSA